MARYGMSVVRGRAHDRNSNRLYRENTETTDKDELYAYDRLNRLTTWHRGNLNGTKDEIPTTESNRVRGQAWGLSPTGNWDDGRTASRSAWKNARSSILHPSGENGDGDYGRMAGHSPWKNARGSILHRIDLDQERKHNDVNEIYDATDAITEQSGDIIPISGWRRR